MNKVKEFRQEILNGNDLEFAYKGENFIITKVYDINTLNIVGISVNGGKNHRVDLEFKDVDDLIKNLKFDGLTLKELLEQLDSYAYT